MINQIRAVLLSQGYQVGSTAAELFAKRLSRVELPPSLQAQIEPLLSLLSPLHAQIEQLEQKLEERAQASEDARRCMTLPGIGPLTSLMFIAALDGATRFRSAHQVMSYLGLVPRENSSGESQKRGHITKAGCTQTRALLVQAAQRILRLRNPDTEVLWIWAEGIAKRRGKRIAVVAFSRRLSGILWAMLRDGQLCQAKRPRAEGEAETVPVRTSTGTQAQAA